MMGREQREREGTRKKIRERKGKQKEGKEGRKWKKKRNYLQNSL